MGVSSIILLLSFESKNTCTLFPKYQRTGRTSLCPRLIVFLQNFTCGCNLLVLVKWCGVPAPTQVKRCVSDIQGSITRGTATISLDRGSQACNSRNSETACCLAPVSGLCTQGTRHALLTWVYTFLVDHSKSLGIENTQFYFLSTLKSILLFSHT